MDLDDDYFESIMNDFPNSVINEFNKFMTDLIKINDFDQKLQAIQNFSNRQDTNDQYRSFLCGICWTCDGIFINRRTLQRVLRYHSINELNNYLNTRRYFDRRRSLDFDMVRRSFPLIDNSVLFRQWSLLDFEPETKVPSFDRISQDFPDFDDSFCLFPKDWMF